MPPQRKNDKRVLKILEKAHPLTFSEIRDAYRQHHHKKITDYSLAENLTILVGRGDVEREVSPPEKGKLKGKITYRLTGSYFKQQLKQEVLNQLKTHELGDSIFQTPVLFFGTRFNPQNQSTIHGGVPRIPTLDAAAQLARTHFSYDLAEVLRHNFSSEEQETVKQLLGVLVWIGHRLQGLDSSHPNKHEQELLKADIEPSLCHNLHELFKEFDDYNLREVEGYLGLYLGEAIDYVNSKLWKGFGEHYTKMQLLHLLAWNIPNLIEKDMATQIKGTLEENKKFLLAYQQLFTRLIHEIKKVKFIALVFYGVSELDEAVDFYGRAHSTVEGFERWLSALKNGELDDRRWIFSEGAKNLERTRRCISKGLRVPPLWIDKSERWNLRDVYTYHRQGKSVGLYDVVLKTIQERRVRIIREGDKGS